MKQTEILNIFKSAGALLQGHFKLSSGLHSSQYLQCALVLQDPILSGNLCSQLAGRFKDLKPDVVVAPAIGGILVSYEVARALGVRSLFTERINEEMTLRRGFNLEENERVLVVEDVVTTGKSTQEVVEVVRSREAKLVGVGAIVDRSEAKLNFGCHFEHLLRIEVPTYPPESCPLCEEGIPVVKPGSRK